MTNEWLGIDHVQLAAPPGGLVAEKLKPKCLVA